MLHRSTPRRPGWSIPVLRVFGIPLRVHVTFLLLPILVAAAAEAHGQPVGTALLFLGLVFVCIALHELGHARVALRAGIRADRVTLYPTGGIAWFDDVPAPRDEWRIAIAGPAVNFGIAIVLAGVLLTVHGPQGISREATLAPTAWGLLAALFWINLSLTVFNLVPAYPMDGGRILRAALAIHLRPRTATRIAAAIGMILAAGLGARALVAENAWFGVLSVVVLLGAIQQARAEQPRSRVERWAEEAMVTGFETLDPDEALVSAAARAAETAQQEFPVVDGDGRVLGVVTRHSMYESLAVRGPDGRVADATIAEVPRADGAQSLRCFLTPEYGRAGLPILIFGGDRVVGIIPADRVREYADLESRRARRRSGSAVA